MLNKHVFGKTRTRYGICGRSSYGGTSIAEFAPTLFILFILFLFPLIALACIGIKYVFFLNAVKQAADAGAKCKYWNLGSDAPIKFSVVPTVNTIAAQGVRAFSGITMDGEPELKVFEGDPPDFAPKPLDMGQIPLQSTNPQAIYTLQVLIKGSLQPLIGGGTFLMPIPGLNAPIQTSAQARVVLESPTAVTNQN